jgi:Calx-beta domain/Galactose oxidase, central domain/Kelch motif
MRNQRTLARRYVGMNLTLVGLLSGAILILHPQRLASAQVTAPSWSYTGSLAIARSLHTATLLQNGKVLVVGGNDPISGDAAIIIPINNAELYDPTTGTWSSTGSLNAGHAFHTATLLQDGKVLVAGGLACHSYFDPCSPYTSAEIYDPATGTWSVTGNLNTARYAFTATLLPNGKVLAVGDGFGRHDAELYDPVTGTWSYTGTLNTVTSRFEHAATLLPNGKVLVAGGGYCGNAGCFRLNSSELYDPATATWSITADLNTSRTRHTTTLLSNGKVLATAGGYYDNLSHFHSLNAAELYDPTTGTWTGTGDLNGFRSNHSATLLPSGKVLVAGGNNNNLESCELYDPTTQEWTNTASFNIGRYGPIATLLFTGKVLVTGDFFDSAELYDPGMPRSNIAQLSAATFSASEGDGSVSITLTRTGDTSGAATVNYATSDAAALHNCDVLDGAASGRCDYTTAVGIVHFAAGQTSKNISIAIVDDGFAEGSENFTITLSNASGATLGSFNTATITINDNETSNGSNPIDGPTFFVRQQYLDFLGREPDPPGNAGWQVILNNCPTGDTSCDRIHVSSSFFRSPEFQGRGYFIYRFYPVVFGRKPDYDEFTPDLANVSGFLTDAELEATKQAFIAEFMSRPAFVTKFDVLSNTAYVDTLLASAGIIHPARDFWIAALGNRTRTRAQVLREITESAEVYNQYYNQAFVVMQYFGYLRRQPDAQYLDWIQTLESTGDFRGMINGFVNSLEYRARFGP